MAGRPHKVGLDYFPLDLDIDQDDKIFYIQARHGLAGYGLHIKLLAAIYREGYYKKFDEAQEQIFAQRTGVSPETIRVFIEDCISVNIYCAEIYRKHHVLTSAGIQKRYFKAVHRRTEVPVIQDFLLIEVPADINPVYVSIKGDNANIKAQRRVEESKVKESIKGCRRAFGEAATDKDLLRSLKEAFPKEDIAAHIKEAKSYLESKNYKNPRGRFYKDFKTFIRNTIKRAKGEPHGKGRQSSAGAKAKYPTGTEAES